MSFIVAGAGVLGSWVALRLAELGATVEIWDTSSKAPPREGASLKAAAMLAPLSELDGIDVRVAVVGLKSLKLWKAAATRHQSWQTHLQQQGTGAVAPMQESAELQRLVALVERLFPQLTPTPCASLSDGADRFSNAVFFKDEAHLNPQGLLPQMHDTLQAMGVAVHWEKSWNEEKIPGRFIVDCRGLGAKRKNLRGVRGEMILLRAPQVNLPYPVRVLHPRCPLYIVPRGDNRYVLGATTIESEAKSAITVQSALELLSTAYAFHAGFGEASVIDSWTALRPAFCDNLPRIEVGDSVLRANGLYRHGWTIAPELARQIAGFLMEPAATERDGWLWNSP